MNRCKPPLAMQTTVAACGMNCALCQAFQDPKNPCSGCKNGGDSVRRGCARCVIRTCLKRAERRPEEDYCFDCDSFPCTRLKALDARYRKNYNMSMIENLCFIRDLGLAAFLRGQEERWRCPECGKMRTVHKSFCLYCRNAQ